MIKMLFRAAPWIVLYLLCLGAATIKVTWADGMWLEMPGWWK